MNDTLAPLLVLVALVMFWAVPFAVVELVGRRLRDRKQDAHQPAQEPSEPLDPPRRNRFRWDDDDECGHANCSTSCR